MSFTFEHQALLWTRESDVDIGEGVILRLINESALKSNKSALKLNKSSPKYFTNLLLNLTNPLLDPDMLNLGED